MDSYLSIAEAALRLARRPLTSREIVELAYRHDLVSSQLFGKTQHKTVGARLSEDILARRERSLFYRNEPGKFFLREFLSDPNIPQEYRSPFVARRRERELRRGVPLVVSRESAQTASSAIHRAADKFQAIVDTCRFHYSDAAPRLSSADELHVWSFVMFMRGPEVLTYRHGRYREGRDAFLRRRSIGFFTRVVDRDLDLFDEGDHGIVASGLRAISIDLDLPPVVFSGDFYRSMVKVIDLVIAEDATGHEDLLTVISVECPPHFEPLTRRLAINDLSWMRLDVPVNHIEDFDPWSQIVVQRAPSLQPLKFG
ncbi:winged helix-turn-helix domain-containing protein [Phenylobacterium sp.]|uniref:winged helix-turn-helix domain-containing protein n=1 Tax=Phenylobacterium sp. TaxID=1871053 RepID=UPI00273345DF|nr:winged helix-turn-helix domain-containing protein [Phenylobacterium sp.]MDP3634112.1 winged helix-turn-helix domain-containing protein [Phenylobacterium sp.]